MRVASKSFEDLLVWQKAHRFVLDVYQITGTFPKSEVYGLTKQLRRAATSVAANIAEGFRRQGKADKMRFMNIAQGSLAEAGYYLILSRDLGYADISGISPLKEEVDKLLEAYSKAIRFSALFILEDEKPAAESSATL
jgi:four helix bundle protein